MKTKELVEALLKLDQEVDIVFLDYQMTPVRNFEFIGFDIALNANVITDGEP